MAVAWLLRPFLLCFTALLALLHLSNSVSETEALLRFKTSLANSTSLASWVPNNTAPCNGNRSWDGLICYNGFVLGLQLERMGLSGKIDVSALADILGLRSVSLMNNSFSGSIPEFNQLGALKALYLSGNQFSGEIPSDYFSKMDSMKKVFLSDNMFTGPIPSSLSRLPNLIYLHLENNQFSGPIPPFRQLTLNDINFSNNKLEGEIPPALSRFEVRFFEGNSGLCGAKLGKDCGTVAVQEPSPAPGPAPTRKGDDGKIKYVVAFVTLGVLLILAVIFFIVNWRRNKKEESDAIEHQNDVETEAVEVQVSVPNRRDQELSRKHGSSGSSKGSNRGGIGELVVVNDEKGVFGLADLMKAAAEVLGNGGDLGSSYKAVMANGVAVVVKRMREMNALSRDGFDAEIKRLGGLRHINILPILGYHYRKDEKLLIYEYIPQGSLLNLLHGDRGGSPRKLDWPARLKIIKGIARGLRYLHGQLANSHELPHGNLKSSNVLLNPDNEPLLSEYGFRPFINTNNVGEVLLACKAPEAVQTGQLSPQCDVYCLGVIILEILTGKFPCQYLSNTKGDGIDIVEWVASAAGEGRASELLDPNMSSSFQNSISEMDKLLYIGAACSESNPEHRIQIEEAVRMIEEIQLESNPETRTIHMLPSLRDGYGDAQSTTSSSYYSNQGYGDQSGGMPRSTSFEASSSSSSTRGSNDKFAFAIS